MKKLFKLYIFTLLICFIGILNVDANVPRLTIDSSTNNVTGDRATNFEIRLDTRGAEVRQVFFTVNVEQPNLLTTNLIRGAGLAGPVTMNHTEVYVPGNMNISSGSTLVNLNLNLRVPLPDNIASRIIVSNVVFTLADGSIEHGTTVERNITLQRTQTTTTTRQLSNIATLRNISLNNNAVLSPDFNPNTRAYTVNIPDTIRSLTISHECYGEGCAVTIDCPSCSSVAQNRVELNLGANEIHVNTVSAVGGATDRYTITVFRGEVNFLQSLRIEGFTLNIPFDRRIVDYEVTVPFEVQDLDIIATLENPEAATVEISGNQNLQVGENIVTVTVTTNNTSESRIYNITVTRLEEGEEEVIEEDEIDFDEEDEERNRLTLILIITGVGLLIIGASWFALFGRKKKKNKKAKPKDKNDLLTEEVKPTEEKPLSADVFDDEKHVHTVETALEDLMNTKEIITKEIDITPEVNQTVNNDDINNNSTY